MGAFTSVMKAMGLIADEDAKTEAQKKKEREEATARTLERAKQNKGKPLNRFQDEADKLKK